MITFGAAAERAFASYEACPGLQKPLMFGLCGRPSFLFQRHPWGMILSRVVAHETRVRRGAPPKQPHGCLCSGAGRGIPQGKEWFHVLSLFFRFVCVFGNMHGVHVRGSSNPRGTARRSIWRALPVFCPRVHQAQVVTCHLPAHLASQERRATIPSTGMGQPPVPLPDRHLYRWQTKTAT